MIEIPLNYLKDHLGTIKMTVDASCDTTGYDDYYPYGQQMDGRCYASSADARYKYTSKERDAESGYDSFGARYYDARVGRWMSVDPLADYQAWGPYTYVLGNPVRLIDPSGKSPEDEMDKTRMQKPIVTFGESASVSPIDVIGSFNAGVERVIELAGAAVSMTAQVSDLSSEVLVGAAVVTGLTSVIFPPAAPELAPVTAGLLKTALVADGISLGAKATSAVMFNDSYEEVGKQTVRIALDFGSAAVFERAASRLALPTAERVVGPAFYSPRNGQFLKNAYGYSVQARGMSQQ